MKREKRKLSKARRSASAAAGHRASDLLQTLTVPLIVTRSVSSASLRSLLLRHRREIPTPSAGALSSLFLLFITSDVARTLYLIDFLPL